ncbi:MAG: hypothetical protein H7Z38_01130 [Rubrivivax sp.]|nr:hypothetical protein [Pyrinomonadaceae bacterium]
MNKEQLLDLTERVKLVAGIELPVIVGSQSLYAITSQVPDSVKRSVECDFLLLAADPSTFRAVIEQIGFASSFQETHGYYADAVGLRHGRAAGGLAGAPRAAEGRCREDARLLPRSSRHLHQQADGW